MHIFHQKSTSVLAVAATLLLVVLLCVLLITLTQMVSMEKRVETLKALVANQNNSNEDKQALMEFIKTDEYIVKWAIENGMLSEDDITYVEGK